LIFLQRLRHGESTKRARAEEKGRRAKAKRESHDRPST
jgi:hypothetical protein